ncbi:MAG TPA: hypothetical protein VE645_04685 [Pseudonocardiaceae bacterium]|nr:hypothetical protein [Pseudonocardiaceae bacterium]
MQVEATDPRHGEDLCIDKVQRVHVEEHVNALTPQLGAEHPVSHGPGWKDRNPKLPGDCCDRNAPFGTLAMLRAGKDRGKAVLCLLHEPQRLDTRRLLCDENDIHPAPTRT